jgi:hypothetical protein
MPHHIFISYTTPDKVYAEALCERLEADSLQCWIAPRNILAGKDWSASIIEAIDHSRAMVLVFSSRANDSSQIKREVENAFSANVTVIPVRVENALPNSNLRYFLGSPQWLDAFTPPFERHLDRIAEAIKVALEPTGTEGAVSAVKRLTRKQNPTKKSPEGRRNCSTYCA